MWAQLFRLIPIILPLLEKLLAEIFDVVKQQKEAKLSDEMVDDIVEEAEKEIEEKVEEILSKYKPSIEKTAQSIDDQKLQTELDELEQKLLQDQSDYEARLKK